MRKLLALAFMLSTTAFFVACSDDDDNDDGGTTTPVNEVRSGVLSADETWTADKIWELDGRVIVPENVTLTIKPGTIIKGQEGEAENASVLIIARGGKIDAQGTADQPIIFTSVLDDIKVGQKMGTNLTKVDNELWGGLIVLGKASVSAKSGDTQTTIEGLPADEPYAVYGAADAASFVNDDNSGTISYVSIRHGGITIGDGNEINGLTLGGVGSGTIIENVEIFATLDDGIEFFGGTVNVKNALVAWQGDDGLDIDQNYSGTVSNFYVTHGKDVGTDEGLEIDGPEGSAVDGKFTLINGTVVNDGEEGSAADLKSDAQGTISNVVFSGYASAKIKIEAEFSSDYDCTISDETDARGNFISGALSVVSSKYSSLSVYSKKDDDDKAYCEDETILKAEQAKVDAVAAGSNDSATGADASVFTWTAASQAGLL